MKELMSYARKKGFNIFCLRTDVKAVAAQKVYARLGFSDLNIKDRKYPSRTYWMLK